MQKQQRIICEAFPLLLLVPLNLQSLSQYVAIAKREAKQLIVGCGPWCRKGELSAVGQCKGAQA